MNRLDLSKLNFFLSPPHECGYFEDRQASSIFADPRKAVTPELYSPLIEQGFRRSGPHIYRPHCDGCSACLSLRIPVTLFQDRRWQRRIRKSNEDLEVQWVAPEYQQEHYELYREYQSKRHAGGGMDADDPKAYRSFLTGEASNSRFAEFRLNGELLAVAVIDQVDHGLSAVYTYYTPNQPKRSLGSFAILWMIDQTRLLGLPYLYLGYWIEASNKMAYKARFLPHEIFENGVWRRIKE